MVASCQGRDVQFPMAVVVTTKPLQWKHFVLRKGGANIWGAVVLIALACQL